MWSFATVPLFPVRVLSTTRKPVLTADVSRRLQARRDSSGGSRFRHCHGCASATRAKSGRTQPSSQPPRSPQTEEPVFTFTQPFSRADADATPPSATTAADAYYRGRPETAQRGVVDDQCATVGERDVLFAVERLPGHRRAS